MAGMLPGVEAARRRRFHHTNLNQGSEISPIRRTSFCLHAINTYESHSNSSMRNIFSSHQQGLCDDESRLCAAAREAKKRLDERFHPQWKSHTKSVESRTTYTTSQTSTRLAPIGYQSYHLSKPQVAKSKKNWLKFISLKSLEQDECAVCLEHLKAGDENLIQVACGHRFHTKCLVPWLEGNANNAHCPCCRMQISC